MGDSSSSTTTTALPEWKRRALAKRQQVQTNIPPEWRLDPPTLASPPTNTLHFLRTSGLLTDAELAITETTSAPVLLAQIANGTLSAVTVTRAFSHRAAIAQQLIGCCTEMFFTQALARAAALDAHLASTGKPIGPLHGLPISFKDLLSVEGIDTTEGWVGQIDQPATSHSPLVSLLIQQGAIPYVKTNISQSIMMADSYNHVFGQSLNPFNRALISGGSSGGEGALVGCRGSIIGFGTDTGGSVRIPSNIQGLYGLAPTVGRLAFEDSGRRKFIAPPVVGPIARDLETMECVLQAYFDTQPWGVDPVVLPIPWRREMAEKPPMGGKKLKIGWYVDDGKVCPQPPVTATVRRVVRLLREAGHEVVEWATTEHAELLEAWGKAIMCDGGKYANDSCKTSGEPLIEGMIVGTEADLLGVEEQEDLASLRVEHQKRYLKRWRESGVDALITPLSAMVGLKPKEWVKSQQYVGYTAVWNWLGFGALACPVGVVDEENSKSEEWDKREVRNESERWNKELYVPELVMGMPVGIEIIGGRFGEEKAISVAKVVEELVAADDKARAAR